MTRFLSCQNRSEPVELENKQDCLRQVQIDSYLRVAWKRDQIWFPSSTYVCLFSINTSGFSLTHTPSLLQSSLWKNMEFVSSYTQLLKTKELGGSSTLSFVITRMKDSMTGICWEWIIILISTVGHWWNNLFTGYTALLAVTEGTKLVRIQF